MKTVMCKKLNKECEALDYLPYPGDLGKRIQDNISKEGWELWVNHQTMLINEMRLTPVDPKARKFLEEEMEKFFFGDGSQAPQGFVPGEIELGQVAQSVEQWTENPRVGSSILSLATRYEYRKYKKSS